jgi:hypothetical protein
MSGESARKEDVQIGDLDDGGIFVGLSAETGKPLHAALADLPGDMTYEEALAAARGLRIEHPTAHVPTPKELDLNLFDNMNTGHLRGTFCAMGGPASVYRSSAHCGINFARGQHFDVNHQCSLNSGRPLPVRLVW